MMERKCTLKVPIAHPDEFLQIDMGWYQLVHPPFILNYAIILSTCFIIQHFKVHQNITVFDTLHGGVVGYQSVFVNHNDTQLLYITCYCTSIHEIGQ